MICLRRIKKCRLLGQKYVFRQLTPREVRELYASIKYSEDENTGYNLYDAGDTGQGYTSEELFDAVSVVMGAKKRKEDRKKAGEVLSHFDGAEMFDLMCREHDEFSNQFYSLIKEYQDSKIIPRTL